MQQNVQPGQNHEQQPALPSYAEAIRAAPPPTNLHYNPNGNNEATYSPSAPFYSTPNQSFQTPYPPQSNYDQVIFPPNTGGSFPPTYTTNSYPQYGRTSDEPGLPPTTIHIIRPIPNQPATCCSGRSGRILAILLVIVILSAILRVTMNSYF